MFSFVFHEETGAFVPHLLAFDALVVQHVGRAFDGHAGLDDVKKNVFFRVGSGAIDGYAFDSTRGLHGRLGLFRVNWS